MKNTPRKFGELPLALLSNMVALATSGFGVVVALAWNEAIQAVVKAYIDPWLGKDSGLISMFIYATVVTVLAVLVTMQLTHLQDTFARLQEKVKPVRPSTSARGTQNRKKA